MIEILYYEQVNKNKLLGYVDVKVTINGAIHVFRKINHLRDGDKNWFNFPSFKRDNADGSSEYFSFHEFGMKVHNTQLLEALRDPVKEFCAKNKIAEISTLDFTKESLDREILEF